MVPQASDSDEDQQASSHNVNATAAWHAHPTTAMAGRHGHTPMVQSLGGVSEAIRALETSQSSSWMRRGETKTAPTSRRPAAPVRGLQPLGERQRGLQPDLLEVRAGTRDPPAPAEASCGVDTQHTRTRGSGRGTRWRLRAMACMDGSAIPMHRAARYKHGAWSKHDPADQSVPIVAAFRRSACWWRPRRRAGGRDSRSPRW